MKNKKPLLLEPINNLLKEGKNSFIIPSYQRGYRWTKTEVDLLLNDIWEFKQNPPKQDIYNENKPFYCLQPIVVKDYKGKWELIDGQQRLTTIFILLKYFNNTEYTSKPKNIFDIVFDTRTECVDFFEKMDNEIAASENIDFYHINIAYKTIDAWFTAKEEENDSIRHDFRSVLINDVKVIWYEIQDNIDAIDVFTRLNIGKIPLTNAELIKALFLGNLRSEDPYEKANFKQLQIASEWNLIEKTLQNDAFWHFIFDKDNKHIIKSEYDTRIEFIFDLKTNKNKDDEHYYTFFEFYKQFYPDNKNEKPDIIEIWRSVKDYFLTFEEWNRDRDLFHLIGFLITDNTDISKLISLSRSQTKLDFKLSINELIAKKINSNFEDFDYYKGADKPKIKKTLLLFNILSMLENSKATSKFPFFSYKNHNWDLEHVRSQADEKSEKISGKERKGWSLIVLEYFTGIEFKEGWEAEQEKGIKLFDDDDDDKKMAERLLKMIVQDTYDKDFDKLYKDLEDGFKEDIPPSGNSISNLVLLDDKTNRGYGNAFFPIKRMEIIKRGKNGYFIPLCTKNVFLKAYSRRFKKIMQWTKTDADDYLQEIKRVLTGYTS